MDTTETKISMLPDILKYYLECWKMSYPSFEYWIPVFVAFLVLFILTTIIFKRYITCPRLPMTKVNYPFTMCLVNQSETFLGVTSEFSSKNACYILGFWGVPTHDFYEMMNMNWSTLKHTLMEDGDNAFKNKCIAAVPYIRLEAGEKISHVFIPPTTVYNDKIMVQGLFPLVIIMLCTEDSMKDVDESIIFFQATIIKVPAIVMSSQRSDNDNASRFPEVMATYLREFKPSMPSLVQIYGADGGGLTG